MDWKTTSWMLSTLLLIMVIVYFVVDYNVNKLNNRGWWINNHLLKHLQIIKRSNNVQKDCSGQDKSEIHTSTKNRFDLLGQDLCYTHNTFLQYKDSPCSYISGTVNCSGLSIKEIQPSWFPNDTQTILLNTNFISRLNNSTFSHLTNLMNLDLSNNYIELIETHAFQGLHNLKMLNLYNHKLRFENSNEFQKIVGPLISLEELNILQYQQKVEMYSFKFLEKLPTLRKLSTEYDLETLSLGEEFRKMSNLTFLTISGNVKIMNDSSFSNVAGLIELHLEFLKNLHIISHNVFLPLKILKVLKMYLLEIRAQYVLSLLEPFHDRNMTEISLDVVSFIHTRVDPRLEGYVTYNDTKYLLNICLETLTLRALHIYYFSADALQYLETWNRCLVNLEISHNSLFGSFTTGNRIMKLTKLQNLTFTDVFRQCFQYKSFPQSSLDIQAIGNERQAYLKQNNDSALQERKLTEKKYEINVFPEMYVPRKLLGTPCWSLKTITISESIKYLNARRMVFSDDMSCNYFIEGAQNLEYLDISDSGFKYFTGTLQGLISVKTLIVSGNDVSVVKESYLDTFPSLENLALASCQLDREFMSIHSGRLFQNLTRLQQLDLSSNLLNYLSTETFMYNKHLKWLTLAQNQFREIPFSLKYTPELEVLDLRQNSLNTIDLASINQLDNIVSRSGHLQLLLSGNVLSCGCNDLQFLHWMRLTSVTFDQNGNFTCINNKGERTYTLFYSELDALWRDCWGSFFLDLALIILCLYIIGISLTFIMIKNKKFIISYFSQILGLFREHTKHDYLIGVFIGYSDRDYLFPCTDLREFIESSIKLKTFLIDRDLIASIDKASGIIDALNASWRILLVCSESFLKEDDWSMFTMRSAIYTQSPANPARVVLLVHKDCLPLLPPELLCSVNDENICVVSEWAMNYEMMQMLTTRLT